MPPWPPQYAWPKYPGQPMFNPIFSPFRWQNRAGTMMSVGPTAHSCMNCSRSRLKSGWTRWSSHRKNSQSLDVAAVPTSRLNRASIVDPVSGRNGRWRQPSPEWKSPTTTHSSNPCATTLGSTSSSSNCRRLAEAITIHARLDRIPACCGWHPHRPAKLPQPDRRIGTGEVDAKIAGIAGHVTVWPDAVRKGGDRGNRIHGAEQDIQVGPDGSRHTRGRGGDMWH